MAVEVVCPLLLQRYVYGGVPPDAITVAVPLESLKQSGGVCEKAAVSGFPVLYS